MGLFIFNYNRFAFTFKHFNLACCVRRFGYLSVFLGLGLFELCVVVKWLFKNKIKMPLKFSIIKGFNSLLAFTLNCQHYLIRLPY